MPPSVRDRTRETLLAHHDWLMAWGDARGVRSAYLLSWTRGYIRSAVQSEAETYLAETLRGLSEGLDEIARREDETGSAVYPPASLMDDADW